VVVSLVVVVIGTDYIGNCKSNYNIITTNDGLLYINKTKSLHFLYDHH